MKNKIKEISSLFFMFCVVILTGLSVMAIWDLLPDDVVGKSMATMGIIAFSSLIVVFAGGFFRRGEESEQNTVVAVPLEPNPIFPAIRKTSVAFIIFSVVLLALIGIMSIWEFFQEDMLFKSLSSIALIAFSFFIMVLTCLVNEKSKLLNGEKDEKVESQNNGVYLFLGIILVIWVFISLM